MCSLPTPSQVMEMNVLADSKNESNMPQAQQTSFIEEANDACYRAKNNLGPDQQVRGLRID